MAKMGDGESKIVGIEMNDKLRLKPKRKVVWNKLKTCAVARETMSANESQRGLVKDYSCTTFRSIVWRFDSQRRLPCGLSI